MNNKFQNFSLILKITIELDGLEDKKEVFVGVHIVFIIKHVQRRC